MISCVTGRRLNPSTNGPEAQCSGIVLCSWWGCQGSNLGPFDYRSNALPAELHLHSECRRHSRAAVNLAAHQGIEPGRVRIAKGESKADVGFVTRSVEFWLPTKGSNLAFQSQNLASYQ